MIDKHDPRLTAYVMGELDTSDSAEIAAALKKSPELQAAVKEIQLVADLTSDAFATQPQLELTPEQKNELLVAASQAQASTLEPPSNATAHRPWLPIAIAASLLGLMVGGAFYLKSQNVTNVGSSVAQTDAQPESSASAAMDQPDAEVVVSNEHAPFSLKKSAQAADELQPPMAVDRAFAMGASLEPKQHLAANDLAIGDNQNKLRGFQPENATGAEKLAEMVARTPRAGLKGQTLPSLILDKADLAFGKHSPGKEADDFGNSHKKIASDGASDDKTLQLAQQTIDASDLASLGIKLTKHRQNKRRQLTVIELSEEQTDEIVLLLANRFDPGNERQLSFAELIGPIASKNPASSVQLALAVPSRGTSLQDIDSELTDASLGDNASTESTNDGQTQNGISFAASQLASAIRRFQQRQLNADEGKINSLTQPNTLRKIDIDNGAEAMRSIENPIASAPVDQDAASTVKKRQSANQNTFAAPAVARQERATKFSSQSLEELNIDYTDLIQQLKRGLRKRNSKVLRLRAPSKPTQD